MFISGVTGPGLLCTVWLIVGFNITLLFVGDGVVMDGPKGASVGRIDGCWVGCGEGGAVNELS